MRWWVCPSPTNERVWFPRHPSYTGFVAFQSCAYLKVVPICALNLVRLGFQHTFSKSNILRLYISLRKMEPLRKPDIKFTQVT